MDSNPYTIISLQQYFFFRIKKNPEEIATKCFDNLMAKNSRLLTDQSRFDS